MCTAGPILLHDYAVICISIHPNGFAPPTSNQISTREPSVALSTASVTATREEMSSLEALLPQDHVPSPLCRLTAAPTAASRSGWGRIHTFRSATLSKNLAQAWRIVAASNSYTTTSAASS